MKRKDREELRKRIEKSTMLLNRAKPVLLSHYATSSWGESSNVVFVDKCQGCRVVDIDGNEYIDMCMGYGPIILGHSHPVVVAAAKEAVETGMVHGFGHEYEVRFAELMVEAIPYADMVTFTNSGTEATMHALKIARAYTGKSKIAKFEGCYHGTNDYVQISGRGMVFGPIEEPYSVPVSPGIPQETVDQVITLSYNQPETFDIIRKNKDQLAAVIVEPIPTCCPISFKDFLSELRTVTRESNIVLIFDEVLSGFRYSYGSVSKDYGIEPDLATFGKIIGGGMPVGAIVGSEKFLKPMISTGDIRQDIKKNVFIVGTFSGNPVTCSAGAAVLQYLRDNPYVYTHMNDMTNYIKVNIEQFARELKLPFQTVGLGSWFLPYFSTKQVNKPRDVDWSGSSSQYSVFREYMFKNGVLLADVPLMFLSAAHTKENCDTVINAIKLSFKEMY